MVTNRIISADRCVKANHAHNASTAQIGVGVVASGLQTQWLQTILSSLDGGGGGGGADAGGHGEMHDKN